jgi:hypothetical protein
MARASRRLSPSGARASGRLSPSGVCASRRPAGPHGSAVRRASRVELPIASLGPACAPELAARPRRALRSTNGRESEPASSSLRYAIGRAKTAPALLKIGPAGHRLARGESGRGQMGSDPGCAHHASARHGGSSQSGSDPFCLSPGDRLPRGAGLAGHRCRSAGETGSEPELRWTALTESVPATRNRDPTPFLLRRPTPTAPSRLAGASA